MNDFTDDYDKAMLKAMRLLTYGPRSRRGMAERLAKYGIDEEIIPQVIAALEEKNFINDEKMAADYVAFAVESKAHGKYRVLRDLSDKLIDDGIAAAAYENYFNERSASEENDVELENAVNTLLKRMKQTGLEADDLDHGDIRRLTGFLHRRGFSFETINRAFSEAREM